MPRLPRFNLPDIPQHVIQRGNNRQKCFFGPDDYRFYLDCLREASSATGCDVHAYVLMTNHVHLLLTPRRDRAVSRLMQSLGRRYVQHVNRHKRRTGTLWEGRYRASPVESEPYLLACHRYIELNPVRARRMVKRPEEYLWSSHHANAYGEGDGWLVSHPLYQGLGRTPAARQRAYRQLFDIALEPGVIREIRESVKQGVVLGGETFREQIEDASSIRATPANRGRPRKSA